MLSRGQNRAQGHGDRPAAGRRFAPGRTGRWPGGGLLPAAPAA